MKVAVLFTRRDEMAKCYHDDWEGRDTNDDAFFLIDTIRKLGHQANPYYVDLDLFEKLREDKKNIDLAFNICDDGFFSDPELEPHVAAMLDILEIPFTGGDYLTLALTLQKARVKKILSYHKIDTPKFQLFRTKDEKIKNLKFPLIVKPEKEDASIGIKDESVVKDEEELRKRAEVVLKEYQQPALVEEFIRGREFNVGFVGEEAMPVSEIRFDGLPDHKPKIVNYDAKWKTESIDYRKTNPRCPAEISKELEKKLVKIARRASRLFGCRDYFRVDFRVDKENRPFVLEINQNPDISRDAGLASMGKAKGYSYKGVIDKIIKSACLRKDDNKE